MEQQKLDANVSYQICRWCRKQGLWLWDFDMKYWRCYSCGKLQKDDDPDALKFGEEVGYDKP